MGELFLYNKQNRMLGNMKFIAHVDTRISHSFASLTHDVSWSTLEINFIFPLFIN